jgi:hypothetical protein
MLLRSWQPGNLEIRGVSRRVAGSIKYRSKGMLSTGSGRGSNERPLGEVIERGAFDFSMRAVKDPTGDTNIFALASHDQRAPLASVRAGSLAFEDGKDALTFEVDVVDTQPGNDVLSLIRSRVATGISFGFILPPQRQSPNALEMKREPFTLGEGDDAVRFDPEPDVPGADVRIIRDLILFEVSLGVARPVFKQNSAKLREIEGWGSVPSKRRALWLP